ncbi:MAG: M1 family metallopeptidase [Planctomycetes bacterium]|nr:M1 family metallopeptidase [Planctomycetota bacterium]
MTVRPRLALALTCAALFSFGVVFGTDDGKQRDKFRQLEELLPTPNAYRSASGAPGHQYWQQRADYVIQVELDDERQHLTGSETITYSNHSPDTLSYLWLQLDPNIFGPESHAVTTSLAPDLESASYESLRRALTRRDFDGSCKITAVRGERGIDLAHTIQGTMMRIDLPKPLASGERATFSVDWNYRINNHKEVGGRTGYERFEKDGNCIYEIAQWFPRMAAYTDVNGWQHKQYLGAGEFTLEFGDYVVSITVPDDHVVAASGVLQNASEVLSAAQRERLTQAESSDKPLFIVTPEEAKANESHTPTGKKTWVYRADNVRDFAFASSRKFIWDAVSHRVDDKSVWAMSYYPKEGEPLWSKYSTAAIQHTLDVYSKHTFTYPYPVAISVNGPVGGMEYPMICFNGPRPEEDGTYSKGTKYGLISVVIHEVGHNYFPMIVNSDERQWTWMDEGLNTFLQYLAEQEWEDDYPSGRGEPANITSYMKSTDQVPIMTNSDSLVQFGNNAYAKPATALNILRETVMGRELFDFAFREYARRWQFKRPQPADFFRTLEDASAVDLDWFWNGWFYSTDACDLALDKLRLYKIDTRDPNVEKPLAKEKRESKPTSLAEQRNAELATRVQRFPELADFYNTYDDLDVTQKDLEEYEKLVKDLKDDQKALLQSRLNFYVVDVRDIGGLVMPVILEAEFDDGSREEHRIAAEVWRKGANSVSKLILSEKKLVRLVLDPHLETADIDLSNNVYPPELDEKRFQLRSNRERRPSGNPMKDARELERKAKDATAPAEPGENAKPTAPVEATTPKGGGK